MVGRLKGVRRKSAITIQKAKNVEIFHPVYVGMNAEMLPVNGRPSMSPSKHGEPLALRFAA